MYWQEIRQLVIWSEIFINHMIQILYLIFLLIESSVTKVLLGL